MALAPVQRAQPEPRPRRRAHNAPPVRSRDQPGHRAELRAALDRLEDYRDDPLKRPNLIDLAPRYWGALGGFASADLPRAQALYCRVVEVGGTNSTYVRGALLEPIAVAQDPASIPFWLEILDIKWR